MSDLCGVDDNPRPTLASDINVANGISDKAKAADAAKLLMHLGNIVIMRH
jgi:hypothetical protein